jgi:hypothetical protein
MTGSFAVYLRHYSISKLEVPGDRDKTWENLKKSTHMLWKSAILFGPGVPGRQGNFQSGHNNVPTDDGLHIGTLGVVVIKTACKRGDQDETIWWALWDFHDGWNGGNSVSVKLSPPSNGLNPMRK